MIGFDGGLMGFIWWFLGLIIWIAIAFWPASVASRKGHSFFWFFIFSLFLWPVALIVAYVIKPAAVAPRS
jgi:phosphoglycerol transferase MdoB-like AlkP superfamily enzyme